MRQGIKLNLKILTKQNIAILSGCLIAVIAISSTAYFVGFKKGKSHVELPKEVLSYDVEQIEEMPTFDEMEKELENADKELKKLIAKSQELKNANPRSGESIDESVNKEALQQRIDNMPKAAELPGAEFYAEPNPSHAESPSGVSGKVLNDYQAETGIDQQKVEELMQK